MNCRRVGDEQLEAFKCEDDRVRDCEIAEVSDGINATMTFDK